METSGDNVGIDLISKIADDLTKSFEEMASHIESFPPTSSLLDDIKQHMFNIQKTLNQKLTDLESKSRAFEEKKAEIHAFVEQRTAAAAAKEQALHDFLQELKDAAISAIIGARENNTSAYPSGENAVCPSSNAPFPSGDEDFLADKLAHSSDTAVGEFEPSSRLQHLCEQMDVNGILKLVAEHRKNITPLRGELPFALRSSPNPALLVLKALEGFYPRNQSNIIQNSEESLNCQLIRRASRLLMESFVLMLGMAELEVHHLLSSEIKKKATVIANGWRHNLAELALDPSNDYSLEAQSFLQLLATFRISSEFDEDELVKLAVVIVRRRRQAFEICHAAGLSHKAPDVMEALIKKGRFLDAAHFAHFFQITEAFPLAPLLKLYLEESGEIISRSNAAGLEKEALYQEFSALKNILRCIEEYNLKDEYPPGDLQKRLDHIKVVMAGNKRAAEIAKFPAKTRRANDNYAVRNSPFPEDNMLKAPYDERSRYFIGRDGYSYNPPGYAQYRNPDERISTYAISPNYGNYGGLSSIRSAAYDNGSYASSSDYRGYIGSHLS